MNTFSGPWRSCVSESRRIHGCRLVTFESRPASAWEFPDPRSTAGDLVAVGGDLEVETLLAAYCRGLFPMPVRRKMLGWWSPAERGILELGSLKVSRSLRASCRRYQVTINHDFEGVIGSCASIRRPGRWISRDIESAYRALHERGAAHSVEVSEEGVLVGGLYGVGIGGLFAGESMFHRTRDASKVALVALVDVLRSAGATDLRLLDVQWSTPHLASLGVMAIPRAAYLDRLETALMLPSPDFTPREWVFQP